MRRLHLVIHTDTALIICLAWAIFFGYAHNDEKLYSIRRYYTPRDTPSINSEIKLFSAPDILKENEKKKFIPVSLTGDLIEDEKRFELIQWKARELKYTNDTTQILKVHLSEAISYGQFIRLLNLMFQDQHKRYFEYNNDF